MRKRTAFDWACLGFIILFLCITVFPFVWIVITSFKTDADIHGAATYAIISSNATLENYISVIVEKGILTAIKNSFINAALTTVYVTITASMSAYMIARYKFKGRSILIIIILGVSMFPQMILIGPIFNMFYKLGWLNSYMITLPYGCITLPSAVWIMITHFKQVPASLEEAAKMDGCTPWQTLWQIVFPIAAPGIFASAILTFISAWNEYLLSLTLNSETAWMSVPVRIANLRDEYTIYWGQITAAAAIVTIPTLIIVLLFQKQIVSGIANGGVKE
ncbi:MAG: carbohydrate ABC transporter permease [Lachnospiraceae bacterium]|jgi:multiple sugar transport system permease protein|nr:carbohydrate ABC transporter permease [Lachnospiraceae bacterium]